MLNITIENPFEVYTDRLIKFGYCYYTMKKNSIIYLKSHQKDPINLFLTNELKIGDVFSIKEPPQGIWDINLPEFDIFNKIRPMCICNGVTMEVVDINSIKPGMIISHQYPNIVTKISKENVE